MMKTLLTITMWIGAAIAAGAPAPLDPPAEGLVLWLDASDLDGDGTADARQEIPPAADGSAVAAWAGRSPRGHRAEQPDERARPVYAARAVGGRAALRFAGGQFLNLGQAQDLAFGPGKPFTIVVVASVAAGDSGTFIARGGGKAAERAWQFYATADRIGAIAGGAMHEAPRKAGAAFATMICDGRRCRVRFNGAPALDFAPSRAASPVDVLVGARRKGADNSGIYYPLRGDLPEVLVYARALPDAELRNVEAYLAGRYGIARYTPPEDAVAKATSPLGRAEALWALANQNRLSDRHAAMAAALLDHGDPFVCALAEWAIATRVGGDNSKQDVRWPRPDAPEWFARWLALPADRRVEADHVRQAVSLGLHRDTAKLRASVAAMVVRAERMHAELGLPREVLAHVAALRSLRERMAKAADVATYRTLWLEARRALRAIALANPAVDFSQLLFIRRFAAHTTRNITRSYPWKHKPGGDIAIQDGLRPDAPRRDLLAGRLGPGFVWGLDLWWDADRVAFAYARLPKWPPTVDTTHYRIEGDNALALRHAHEPLHIFEARLDGSPVRQVTADPAWNDFEPTYCADGRIAFASDRCGRSAECGAFSYDHANPNLYACAPDGSHLRQLTDNKDIDRYPHTLDNGAIAYTHWEYQERHFMEVHSLWTLRPDGTMSDTLFKHHMSAPCGLRDARSVPGSSRLVAVATGHHTFAYGPVVLVDASHGTNSASGLRVVTPGVRPQEGRTGGRPVEGGGVADRGGFYQTPWALSETCFLAAYAYARPKCPAPGGVDSNGFGIYLIDVFGNKELIARDPLLSCSFPIPLRKRPRPPLPPDVTAQDQPTAVCCVTDVYQGLPDVPRGTIRHIRVAQHVGWPLDSRRGKRPYLPGNAYARQFGFWSWSPVRILGTVAVERDGSACFRVPANTALYFQALDERHMEVRRMRSMVSLQRGEVRGCLGCHETRAATPASTLGPPLALRGEPVVPKPPPWGAAALLDYETHVQPVLDRACVRCHGAEEPDGGIDLSPTRAADGFVQSFRTLFGLRPGAKTPGKPLVACADRFSNAAVSGVRQFGSHKSPFITVLLRDELHRKQAKLTEAEWLALVSWVDANAPYYGSFFDKRPPDGGQPRRDHVVAFPPPYPGLEAASPAQ